LIFTLSGAVTFWLFAKNREDHSPQERLWLGFHALAAGSGVWAANVLACLGLEPGYPVTLAGWAIGASLAAAVGGSMLAFGRQRSGPGKVGPFTAAALNALSFAVVHFATIAGLRGPGVVHLNLAFQPVAVLATFGLTLTGRLIGGDAPKPGRAAVVMISLVMAVGALHFISLAGLTLTPAASAPPITAAANPVIAAAVAAVTLVLLGMSAGATIVATMGEQKALWRLRTATNAMPSALALFDANDRLVVWNTTFELVMGSHRERVREGMPLSEMAAAMPAPRDGRFNAARSDGAMPRERSRTEFPIPGDQWIRVDRVPTEDGGLLTLGTDITEIRESAEQLADALDRAEAANRSKSEFLATMSHEIRTPLNGVLGMAQAMRRDALSPAQLDQLKVIQSAGEVLLTLLNDVLDISKIESGKIALEDGVLDAAALGASVQATFSALAAEKDVSLELEVTPDANANWRGDPVRVRQILQNLVSNAVKFTERGSVSIRIDHDGQALMLRVADTGFGIAFGHQTRIFERFAQEDASTTRRFGGSGLGSAICKALVDLMGGEIALDSAPGCGATFTVRLPLERASESAVAEDDASSGAVAPAQSHRILAAEDNAMNQLVLKTLLGQLGLDPVVVENGEEALRAWEAEHWDVILMDVQMPVMDGPTATRRIRELELQTGRPRTPIIALTANAMAHHTAEYAASGMDGLVPKPIRLIELVQAIEAACNGPIEPERGAAAAG
jgi:signal transduction histidine kinase/CheY-like chemotaxis protein/NO-binding membrane sensor protein with MHYT domain